MATATERLEALAKRKAARAGAGVVEHRLAKGDATKGTPKTGIVKRRKRKAKTSSPGTEASTETIDLDLDLEALPKVDAAPSDGGQVERND